MLFKIIFSLLILIFLFSNLPGNPLIPYFISEIQFAEGSWYIELSDHLLMGITNFNDCYLASSCDTVQFNYGIEFPYLYALVIDQSFLQDSINIDPAGDMITFWGTGEHYPYDMIKFGDYPGSGVNSPEPDQSLARVFRYYEMSTDYYPLLVKENNPTLGNYPFEVTTYGAISGNVYDINGNPIEGAAITLDHSPYDLAFSTDGSGAFFQDLVLGMNYELELNIPPSVFEVFEISIEPDSMSIMNFNTNYDTSSVEYNQIKASPSTIISYPNPFNPSVTIEYEISDKFAVAECRIEIFNIKGQKLISLPLRSRSSNIIWEAPGQPSGTYLVKLSSGKHQIADSKITFLK